MKFVFFIIAFVGISVLISCSSTQDLIVHRHAESGFRGLKTFDILHVDTVQHPRFMDKILVKELQDLGFERDTLSPDFTVSYAGKVDKRYGMQRMMPGMYGPGWGWHGMAPYGPTYSTYEFLESSLVIDFLDLENGVILWQGSFNDRVNKTPNRKDINKAVNTIFKQFAAQYKRNHRQK